MISIRLGLCEEALSDSKYEEQLKHWCAEHPPCQRDILHFFLLYHIYYVISHRYTHFEPTNFNLTFNIPHATHERMKKIKLLANCLMHISPDEPLDRHLFATFTNNIQMLYFLKEKTDNMCHASLPGRSS